MHKLAWPALLLAGCLCHWVPAREWTTHISLQHLHESGVPLAFKKNGQPDRATCTRVCGNVEFGSCVLDGKAIVCRQRIAGFWGGIGG